MKVTSTGIQGNFWKRKYGKFGKDFIDAIPSLSVPFAIHNPPQDTQAYAIMLIDNDAIRNMGHSWIHWLVSDLEYENVAENESRSNHVFVQGQNSWGFNYYGGMAPHDAPHQYDLYVYALDQKLGLKDGFTASELHDLMYDKILERAIISAMYSN